MRPGLQVELSHKASLICLSLVQIRLPKSSEDLPSVGVNLVLDVNRGGEATRPSAWA